MTEKLRVLESFSGIGTQRMALRNIGVDHEVVAISEIDKFAIQSYEAIHGKTVNLGDISNVKVEDVPDHDLFTYSFPCFVAGTLIYTDKGYKNIEDIQKDDMVLTHKNRFRKVVSPMRQKADYIVEVNTMGSEKLYVTEEHPFYVREKYYEYNDNHRHKNGQMKKLRKFHSPKWVNAEDLDTKIHYVGVSVNDKSELPIWSGVLAPGPWGHEKHYNSLNDNSAFNNPNFWWLVGRYIGDGWSRDYQASEINGWKIHDERIVVCCNKSETIEIESRLEKLGWLTYTAVEEPSVIKYHIVNKELKRYLEQFGHLAHNKKLTSDIFNLPIDLLRDFVSGYLSADGSLSQGFYRATSTSQELIYGMSRAINKAYCAPTSVYKTKRPSTCVIEGRTVNQKDSYCLSFKKKVKKQDNAFYEDGYIWYPITSIERDDSFNGYVYNMEVEEDNTYTANNIIVHNCQDLSAAGLQRGMIKGKTRSGLLYECERIIESKMPKYLLMENVKNLVSKKFKPFFDEWLEYLESLGYTNYWKVLNGKDYGVPQHRERVFVVSILGEHEPYEFPEPQPLTVRLRDVLDEEVDEKFYLKEEQTERLIQNSDYLQDLVNDPKINILAHRKNYRRNTQVFDPNGITETLDTGQGGGRGHYTVSIPDLIIDDTQGYDGTRYYTEYSPTLRAARSGLKTIGVKMNRNEVKGEQDIARTLLARDYKGFGNQDMNGVVIAASRGRNPENPSDRTVGSPTVQRLEVNKDGVSNTLTTVQKDNYVVNLDELRIRKLTPKECFRLMDISDEDFYKAESVNSNSQLYKQAGNAIIVPVLEGIFSQLF